MANSPGSALGHGVMKNERGGMKKNLLVLISFSLILSGCGRGGPAEGKNDLIGLVNKEPITASELKRNIALKARQDPAFKVTPETEGEQLELIINKKLLIQEAMAKGLAREERFVNTIRTFWEQTLIRDFLDFKRKEFQDYLFVTEDEIKKYYDNLGQRVTFKILRSKDPRIIDDAYNKVAGNKDAEISGWELIGPVGYEDVDSPVLLKAFSLPIGAATKAEDAPNHYIIVVVDRETVGLEPLKALRPGIEKRILEIKERDIFENWLKSIRKKADITIFKR